MRVRVVLTAIVAMAAAPAWAQPQLTLATRPVLPANVICADLHVSAMPVPTLTIAGAHHPELRLALNRDEVAVVHRLVDDGLAVGQRYLVRRMPSSLYVAPPREGGYVPVRTVGWLTVTALDAVNAMAHIDFACDAIEPGDFLVPYVEPVLPTPDVNPPAPDFSERVALLPGTEGRQMFGGGDLLSLARGADNGVTVGARYAIYRDRKDGKPLVYLGEAIVTDLSATSAKLFLLSTKDVVTVNDIAVPRH